jgi:hypothetical protein
MTAARSLLIVLCLLTAGLPGAAARQVSPPSPSPFLDPACIRFNDPTAVMSGEIVYAGFTAYEDALAHAIAVWSPAEGFAVALREAAPAGDAVPADATLIYRDVRIPGAGFKGVTATWNNAPATVTLNRDALPAPDAADAAAQELLRAVMTHETGHALGLGDVPAPGVNIRECAAMLMKRSVDKGGGRIDEPQVADIALYCMRWGGTICADQPPPTIDADPDSRPMLAQPPPAPDPMRTYRYLVATCDRLPAEEITPPSLERSEAGADSASGCVRAPAGILFHVQFDDGVSEQALTGRHGEFLIQVPGGQGADIGMPQGGAGRFPSLLGFEPVTPIDRIAADDPTCEGGEVCERVYVLVP